MNLVEDKKNILRETFLVWLVTIILIRLLIVFRFVPLIQEISSLATAVLLLYIPLGIFYVRREKVGFLDKTIRQFFVSISVSLAFSLIIFSLAVAVVVFMPFLSFHLQTIPDSFSFFFTQLVMVALPEEFFFRGYMQEKLNQVFDKRKNFLGVPVGTGFLVTALVFALSHSLIRFQFWHILIFFPALSFGWLREKTGSIAAPVIFHALCNVFSYWVTVSL